MTTSRVDFNEVRKLGTEVRRAQSALDAGVQGFSNAPSPATSVRQGRLPVATPFGNTSAGAACLGAQQQASSTMGGVLKAFAATVDSDAERLELALALYRTTDAEAADKLLKTNRNRVDLFSTHLSVADDGHAQDQAKQITELRTMAGDQNLGNTVVAGDFNALSTGNSPSAQAIRDFGRQGFDVNAGDIHDGRGGTSASNRRIDHVLPRGVGASEATRWDRTPSDHDGQVVDLTLSNW
ncbi:endonuclease/exonuclease/phosphatase family protein [Plantactinospora solaniradicis]|uniref:Endonuclease/exonuclease/phosphatase family protein n=1 Tax=Plantactinospora solaniradicis TaxID=1723736 RepID=A0ABW1K0S9_9ACTN